MTGSIPEQIVDSPVGWVADHLREYVDSGGERGHEWRPGVPTLLLTTTGRRTGVRRRTALIYGRSGTDFVVVASKGGAPDHPAWYLNLQADPAVQVQVLDEVFDAKARTVTGGQRAELWAGLARIWPSYDQYAARTQREIPVVVLTRS